MMRVLEVVRGEAAVVVVTAGVFAAGSGHGFLSSSSCQLTETPPQTTLTPVTVVRTRIWPTQAWGRQSEIQILN